MATPVVAAMFDAPWTPVFLLVAFMLHFWIGILAVVAAILLVTLAWLNQRATQKQMEVATLGHGGGAQFAAGGGDARHDRSRAWA